ncbi:MAG: sterol desaturase family protein [Proteobacteria bacterium]|nr:MAG: sterol desaturase family protein [Pseudomonadota bacterium]
MFSARFSIMTILHLDHSLKFIDLRNQYPGLFPLWILLELFFGMGELPLFWGLLLIVALGVGLYLVYDHKRAHFENEHAHFTLSAFREYAFPTQVFSSLDTRSDLFMMMMNGVILKLPFLAALYATTQVGPWITEQLKTFLGTYRTTNVDSTWLVRGGYLLAAYLVNDFAQYWSHRLGHRIPWLWALHRVHHSSSELSFLTAFREHPVFLFGQAWVMALSLSLLQGLTEYFAPGASSALDLFAGTLFSYVILRANFFFGHFSRPLSYGWLDYWVISPSVHRVHHSADPAHHHFNYGSRTTLWDWMFVTLHVPSREELEQIKIGPGENVDQGLDSHPKAQRYRSHPLYTLYWEPTLLSIKSLIKG